MSNKNIDELIENTILKKDPTLQNEINLLFSNEKNYPCAPGFFIINPFNITSNNVNYIKYFLKYYNIIPNIFRQCWCNYTPLITPNICPVIYYTILPIIYLPEIIDAEIIKALFYYGFSDEVQYKTETIPLNEKVKPYRKINNSRAYYDIITIIFNIFNKNSMFIKFYYFFSYLRSNIQSNGNGKIINNYNINWYCVDSCNCPSGILQDTTVDNTINTINLTINDFININNLVIKNSPNQFISIIRLYKEVFNDMYQQIYYFFLNKEYCLKPYMKESFIPTVMEKYNTYVTNFNSL
jgi:hypothetical protein